MQFGKTLVGAMIGAALGIGLMIVVYLQFGIDKMYMAIPVALLTGFGVRLMVAGRGHASYLRGAVTVVIALAAYLGGLSAMKAVASHRTAKVVIGNAQVGADEAAPAATKNPESNPGAPGAGPPTKSAAETKSPRPSDEALHRAQMPRQFSTWDFLALAVAALVAYELGRGTGGVTGSTKTVSSEPAPAGTHPDA